MRDYKHTIPAGDYRRINTPLRFAYVKATGSQVVMMWEADTSRVVIGAGDTVPLRNKDGGAVTDLRIVNESGASRDVEITAGPEEEGYRSSGGTTQIAGPLDGDGHVEVSEQPADTLQDQADTTVGATSAAEVIAADSTRKTAYIQLPAGAASGVRVGSSNVSGSRGLELQPGDSITVETTDAVYVYNPSGSGVNVAAAWTSK